MDKGDYLGETGEGDYILINKKVIVTYSQNIFSVVANRQIVWIVPILMKLCLGSSQMLLASSLYYLFSSAPQPRVKPCLMLQELANRIEQVVEAP